MAYKDGNQRREEDKIISLLFEHRPLEPLTGPLRFKATCYLPIPKSKSKKWQAAALAGVIRPDKKPDWDNLGKNLCDVMNRVFWEDDSQIVDGHVVKLYGAPARWEVEIEQLSPAGGLF